jgi:methionyl aminopeptidase
MIRIKTPEQIEIMREGGKILAKILQKLKSEVKPLKKVGDINVLSNNLCSEYKVIPVFLNYTPHGAGRPFPGSVCISINDEVVHGIPNEKDRIFKEGDLVSLDMGIKYKDLIVDSAITIECGKIDKKGQELLSATKLALEHGIKSAVVGNKTGDIGHAIEKCIKQYGFGIPGELGGHGVGFFVHEDPFVPNFGKPGQGAALKPGMTIAIEPIINEGTKKIYLDKDGYTLKTADGKRSAHFEHTVVITEDEPIILTTL